MAGRLLRQLASGSRSWVKREEIVIQLDLQLNPLYFIFKVLINSLGCIVSDLNLAEGFGDVWPKVLGFVLKCIGQRPLTPIFSLLGTC